MRRFATCVLALALAGSVQGQSLQEILDSKALSREYNPVLVGYLLEEGKSRLPAKQQKDALDQQLARFREEINVRPSEEITAGVATLAGMLLKGDVGAGIAQGAAEIWSGWVDAAIILQRAGYAKEVIPFYQNCIKSFPYENLQARCATALAAAEPEQAIPFLIGVVNDKAMPDEAKSAALRTLGHLAAGEKIPKAQREAAIAELIKRTEGFMNNTLYAAAVDGLVLSRDPRAVEPLRKMTKGMTKGDEIKRPALRGLALVFKDPAGIETLKSGLKGGMMSNADTQIFSASTLILADEQAGFDWATEKLTPKKKSRAGGFLAKVASTDRDKADPEPALMRALLDSGGEKSKALLAQIAEARSPGEWVWARANISLLLLGDTSRMESVKTIVSSDDYVAGQRVDAAVALAKQKDYSGIAPLASILANRKTEPYERMAIARALATIDQDQSVPVLTDLLADKDADVRVTAAYALTGMTRPSSLDGIAKALGTDFSSRANSSRNATVHAYLLRHSAQQFGKESRTKALIENGKKSEYASVRFLALTVSGSASPAKKKS